MINKLPIKKKQTKLFEIKSKRQRNDYFAAFYLGPMNIYKRPLLFIILAL